MKTKEEQEKLNQQLYDLISSSTSLEQKEETKEKALSLVKQGAIIPEDQKTSLTIDTMKSLGLAYLEGAADTEQAATHVDKWLNYIQWAGVLTLFQQQEISKHPNFLAKLN